MIPVGGIPRAPPGGACLPASAALTYNPVPSLT
jgi:hypothetical protein